MKKILLALPALALAVLPVVASAHEHDVYTIGGTNYQFVVGSLNEPVAVDDKTGLDLTVTTCFTSACGATMGPDGDMDGPAGKPVSGLESMLKVVLVAGSNTKTLALTPQYGQPGKYQAVFYPTVATTFSYRITGEINKTPVDLTFTCVPEGTPKAADDMTAKKLSDGVTRIVHGGAFGCPSPKEDLGFPKAGASVSVVADSAGSAKEFGIIGMVLGILGLAVGGAAYLRRTN